MAESNGFEDLDGVLDDEGNVKEEELSSDVDERSTVETSSGDSSPLTGRDTSPRQGESDGSEQTPVSKDGKPKAVPDPTVVEELASEPVPGREEISDQYSYAMRRSDYQDERAGNFRFVMRPGTKELEQIAAEEVLEELYGNTGMCMTDLREAAYIAGLQNLDEVVDVLNQWGFAEQEELHK